MIGVITGDIVNSRSAENNDWLGVLKRELGKFGTSPADWEIYRGDAFQLLVKDPPDALEIAIRIRSAVKSIKNIDVRMAIGIGEIKYGAERVLESNGSAFVYSGAMLEALEQSKQNMAIKTDRETFDSEMNLYLKLAAIAMDNWTQNSAEAMNLALEFPEKSQEELGAILGIKQNAVSGRLSRAYFDEILQLIEMYRTKLKQLL